MERARYLLQEQETQVDEYDIVDALYELKELKPTPEVVEIATTLEGIVIDYLMSEWERSVTNVLTYYMEKHTHTTDDDFESEMRFIASRAEALKDATVLFNPKRPPNTEVEKRLQNLREVIKNVEDFLG